jgi:hypothetical protein
MLFDAGRGAHRKAAYASTEFRSEAPSFASGPSTAILMISNEGARSINPFVAETVPKVVRGLDVSIQGEAVGAGRKRSIILEGVAQIGVAFGQEQFRAPTQVEICRPGQWSRDGLPRYAPFKLQSRARAVTALLNSGRMRTLPFLPLRLSKPDAGPAAVFLDELHARCFKDPPDGKLVCRGKCCDSVHHFRAPNRVHAQ